MENWTELFYDVGVLCEFHKIKQNHYILNSKEQKTIKVKKNFN